jgi:hypothetical protein
MVRPWLRFVMLLWLVLPLAACGDLRRVFTPQQELQGLKAPVATRPPQPQPPAVRQRMAEERCRRERPGLEARMEGLRRAELRLAQVKEETYVPLTPPAPWDESKESRYRQEDRDADWLRDQQAGEAWRRREKGRRESWSADHQERLRQAQWHLDRQTQELRAQRPDLFTGPGSIEFHPDVVERIRSCREVGRAGSPAAVAGASPASPRSAGMAERRL